MNDREIYAALVREAKIAYPDFEIRYKDESRLFAFLRFVLFFSPSFHKKLTTTIGSKVYFPSRTWAAVDSFNTGYRVAWKILAHELVHVDDYRRLGWRFFVLYLSPQMFAVFSLLTVFSWWHLLWLICLLPWPSPGRAWLEMRGYTMSMAVNYWRFRGISRETRLWIVAIFSDTSYYWMWPFKSDVMRRIREQEKAMAGVDFMRSGCLAYEIVFRVLRAAELGKASSN